MATSRRRHMITETDDIAAAIDIAQSRLPGASRAELRVSTGCKLPGCCVLALAQLLGAGVLTFDERLGRAAAALTG